MKKNINKKKINVFILLLIFTLLIGIKKVDAATYVSGFSFSGSATAWGGNYRLMGSYDGLAADYVKVTVNTSGGDTYDLRYMYSSSWVSNANILATKGSLPAHGTTSIIYFIPQNGSCPVTDSSKCVKVPIVSNVSSANQAKLYYDMLYGIEIHNGSILGGTLSVSGTCNFYNYN